jgi:hypothetical protein
MEILSILGLTLGFITTIVAIVGVTIALLQLKGGRQDAQAARMAELSWQIYQAYETEEIRASRRAIEIVARSQPIPQTGEEYGAMYRTFTYQGEDADKVKERAKNLTGSIRRMLRFYHQVGILLEKGLIDPDFVFPLIGHGLETSEQGIKVTTEWHQNYYAGEGFTDKAERRNLYGNAVKLCENYHIWKKRDPQNKQAKLKSLF